jgi:hypothetical protein
MVAAFVADVLPSSVPSTSLARLGVVTTTVFGAPRLDTPRDRNHLSTLLIQSCFIPGVTGSGWSHKSRLDGGLSAPWHPWPREHVLRCPSALRGGWRTALDGRLSEEAAALLYNLGVEAGRRK